MELLSHGEVEAIEKAKAAFQQASNGAFSVDSPPSEVGDTLVRSGMITAFSHHSDINGINMY